LSAPQANIAGFDGSNLLILSGGSADASASPGNTRRGDVHVELHVLARVRHADRARSVTVPTAATGFSLKVDYKGGYSVTRAGGIQQVDLVPGRVTITTASAAS
jgi:hypothetical protein